MKKILYFVKKEVVLLKKSIILVTCILTVFLSVFIGLLSVRTGFVDGCFSLLDENYSDYTITVYRVNPSDFCKVFDERECVFSKFNLTSSVRIYNESGEGFDTTYFTDTDFTMLLGAMVGLNKPVKDKFDSSRDALVSGEWLDGAGQICIEKNIADILSLTVGEEVFISGNYYTVKGIYDLSEITAEPFFRYYYYLYAEGDALDATIFNTQARAVYSDYTKLKSAGYSTGLWNDTLRTYFEIFSPIEWIFNCVSIIVFVVIVVILYTLMTIFFRQRKGFICQLKLLGADYKTILGVYLFMAIAIVFASSLLAAGIAVLLNLYFVNLLKTVFEVAFRVQFNAVIPLISFIFVAALTAVLYIISIGKIKTKTIAQEIKCE